MRLRAPCPLEPGAPTPAFHPHAVRAKVAWYINGARIAINIPIGIRLPVDCRRRATLKRVCLMPPGTGPALCMYTMDAILVQRATCSAAASSREHVAPRRCVPTAGQPAAAPARAERPGKMLRSTCPRPARVKTRSINSPLHQPHAHFSPRRVRLTVDHRSNLRGLVRAITRLRRRAAEAALARCDAPRIQPSTAGSTNLTHARAKPCAQAAAPVTAAAGRFAQKAAAVRVRAEPWTVQRTAKTDSAGSGISG